MLRGANLFCLFTCKFNNQRGEVPLYVNYFKSMKDNENQNKFSNL